MKVFGTKGSDSLTGSERTDKIRGFAGDDIIYGHGGADSRLFGISPPPPQFTEKVIYLPTGGLFGGAGNDTIYGDSGADLISGGSGDDLLVSGSGGTSDTAQVTDLPILVPFLRSLNFDLVVTGGIFGGSGNDTILGGDGGDSARGDEGDDQLFGGAGQDILDGGSDNDWIQGDDGNDELSGGTGDDELIGGEDNDNLFGEGGNDQLSGDNGNDVLRGTEEDTKGLNEIDTLNGGAGEDIFVLGFSAVNYFLYDDQNPITAGILDYALITDFNPTEDTIHLTGSASLYLLAPSLSGLPAGAEIYLDNGSVPGSFDSADELLAILAGVQPNDLNLLASYFTYS